MSNGERIKIDEPLWDQSSFIGRFKHFLFITDPRSCIVPDSKLYEAKTLVEQYRYLYPSMLLSITVIYLAESEVQ